MNQFASNLKAQIGRDLPDPAPAASTPGAPAAAATPPPAAKPISGFSLMAKVIWASIMKLFGRRAP
jgi:hypothetical protein